MDSCLAAHATAHLAHASMVCSACGSHMLSVLTCNGTSYTCFNGMLSLQQPYAISPYMQSISRFALHNVDSYDLFCRGGIMIQIATTRDPGKTAHV